MLERLMRSIKDAIFPRRCSECDKRFRPSRNGTWVAGAPDLTTVFAAGTTDCLCDDCARAAWVDSPMCVRCGLPFASSEGVDHLCSRCQDRPFRFDAARSAGAYQDALRLLVQNFKYRGQAHLAGLLGRLLWATLVKHWDPADFDCIIPVPLHPRRMLQRGFNQAEQMTRCWPLAASETATPFDPGRIASRLLIRHRHTSPQTGLDRSQRQANLRRAFRLKNGHSVNSRHILLVDDVLTTGATADACSRVLKRAGAASVNVLTVARSV